MKKVDIHTHILPPDWPDLAERFGGGKWLSMQRNPRRRRHVLRRDALLRGKALP